MLGFREFVGGPWDLDVFTAANLCLFAGLYYWGVRRVEHWPRPRSLAFGAGLVLLGLVYLGPVSGWSHTFFWAHMVQHLVVMMIAAPLLVLGAPLQLAWESVTPAYRERWLAPALQSRVVTFLTHPVTGWVVFAGVLLGTHFSGFYDWALRNHDIEILVERPLYLMAALLYYLPLVGTNPLPRRLSPPVKLISLGTMMIPEAIVGAAIYFSSVVLYPTYDRPRPFGPDPITDQHISGALMWALVMGIDSIWMMVVAGQWLTAEEARSVEVDAQIAQELERS